MNKVRVMNDVIVGVVCVGLASKLMTMDIRADLREIKAEQMILRDKVGKVEHWVDEYDSRKRLEKAEEVNRKTSDARWF